MRGLGFLRKSIKANTANLAAIAQDVANIGVIDIGNNWHEITGNTTLALTDATKVHHVRAAAIITVPPYSSVAFSKGTEMVFMADTASDVSFVAGENVLIKYKTGLKINGQGAGATLKKMDKDENGNAVDNLWWLVGDLKA